MFKKRYFFMTYLITVIPVLLASIFAFRVILGEMVELEDEMLRQQLADMKETFVREYLNYHDEGVIMGSRTELLPYKMLGNPLNADAGIDLLREKCIFDDDILDVFVTYETEKVYSSNGVSRKGVYFGSTLNCDEQSMMRVLEAVDSDIDMVCLLFDKVSGGNILFSYKLHRTTDASTSINFVMEFEQLYEMLHISNENQYCELELSDGTSIVLGSDAKGEVIFRSQEEWHKALEKEKYTVFEERIDELGVILRLYYNKDNVPEVQWIQKTQMVNTILSVVGITWALVLSWFYNRKQVREIMLLESTTKGEEEQVLSSRNVYYDLQSLIMQGIYQNRKLEENMVLQKEQLRDNLVFLIFRGECTTSLKS